MKTQVIELKADSPPEKRRKRLRKVLNAILIAVPVALLLRAFVIKGASAAPEIPRGSWVLAWKLSKNCTVGETQL